MFWKRSKPLLKQLSNLKKSDFENYPVWVHCHIIDYEEPWYDDTDEETFRPWTRDLPVDPSETMFLVAAEFMIADGTQLPGFLTPQDDRELLSLGVIQPYIFAPEGSIVSFWFGGFPIKPSKKETYYQALGKNKDQMFPVHFNAKSGLAKGITSGLIPGFCSEPTRGQIVVEK